MQNNVRDDAVLMAMVNHWIHEDNLFWQQTTRLLQLEFAVLASWYILREALLGPLIVILATYLIIALYGLTRRIRQNREANRKVISSIAARIASQETRAEAERSIDEQVQRIRGKRRRDRAREYAMSESPFLTRHPQNALWGWKFQEGLFFISLFINALLVAGSITRSLNIPELAPLVDILFGTG